MGRSSGGSGRTPNALRERTPDARTQRALRSWESRHLALDHEEALVVDPTTGAKVFQKRGDSFSVDFSDAELASMQNMVLTHNHPPNKLPHGQVGDGGPFSEADIFAAGIANLTEIRAVTQNYTYRLIRPAKGWSTGMAFQYSIALEGVNKRSRNRMLIDYVRGRYSTEKAAHYHQLWTEDGHAQMAKLAKKYNVEYIREPR